MHLKHLYCYIRCIIGEKIANTWAKKPQKRVIEPLLWIDHVFHLMIGHWCIYKQIYTHKYNMPWYITCNRSTLATNRTWEGSSAIGQWNPWPEDIQPAFRLSLRLLFFLCALLLSFFLRPFCEKFFLVFLFLHDRSETVPDFPVRAGRGGSLRLGLYVWSVLIRVGNEIPQALLGHLSALWL